MTGTTQFYIKLIITILASLLFSLAMGQPLLDTRICLDAGHGGHTSDDRQIFLPNGIIYWESEGVLEAAFHLKDLLEELGAEVKMTRTDNTDESDISLSERSAIANAFGADFFHSIHTNGGGGTYSLVLYKEENGFPTFPLAQEMGDIMAPNLQDLMKTNANYNRGDLSFLGFNLGVLKFANMPSTLSESSFHDLPEEGLRLKNSEYLKNYAWAMAKSFLSYFEVDGFSTGRVGGVIRDVTYGTVVNEVTVECLPVGTEYTGDDNYNGFYAIGDLDPGNYQLVISKNGYLNDTTTVNIIANEYSDLDRTIQYFNNGFPNVDFYVSGLPAGAGEQLTFNAGNSTDDGEILYFSWDFGDGSSLDTGLIINHSFMQDGTYEVTLTATDNDGNQAEITKSIEISTFPPISPKLLAVAGNNTEQGIKIFWQKNPETNILGYNLYISEQRNFTDTIESIEIPGDFTSYEIDSFGSPGRNYYFRLTAENLAFKESKPGDTYVYYASENDTTAQKILIIDGFNRNGSFTGSSHDFVATYAESIVKQDGYSIHSCSNSSVGSGYLDMADYDIVFWFLGDESTANETFNSWEQARIAEYLQKGGKLFVSGSEIGWDLVAKGSIEDKTFYQDYLKAEYLADGSLGMAPATGIPGSGFEGTTLHFGEVYPEDYPDEIGEYGGSDKILNYVTGVGAGIKFKGIFEDGDIESGLVYIAFPLESVANQDEIDYFIEKVLNFFNEISNSNHSEINNKNTFELYPTLIDNQLDLYHELQQATDCRLTIYSINGLKIFQQKARLQAGKHRKTIQVDRIDPGFYFLVLETSGQNETIRFIKR